MIQSKTSNQVGKKKKKNIPLSNHLLQYVEVCRSRRICPSLRKRTHVHDVDLHVDHGKRFTRCSAFFQCTINIAHLEDCNCRLAFLSSASWDLHAFMCSKNAERTQKTRGKPFLPIGDLLRVIGFLSIIQAVNATSIVIHEG